MPILQFFRQNRTFLWLTTSALVSILGFAMFLPLTALQLDQMGRTKIQIGIFSAIPWIVILASSFLVPSALRRCSFRTLMVGATFLGAVIMPGFLVTRQYGVWCLVNAVFGLSIAVRWVLVESWIMQNAPREERGRFLGLYQAGLCVVYAVGPAFLALTGTNGRGPLLLPAAFFLVSFFLILPIGKNERVSEESSAKNAFKGTIKNVDLVLMLAAFIGGIHDVGTTALGPVYALKKGLSSKMAAQVATLIGVGSFLTQYPVGWLSDRRGAPSVLIVSLLVLLVGPLFFLFLPVPLLSVSGMAFIWGAAGGALYILAEIRVSNLYRDQALIRGTARMIFAYTLGSILGPLIGGAAFQLNPTFGLPVALLLLTAIALAAVLFLQEKSNPTSF